MPDYVCLCMYVSLCMSVYVCQSMYVCLCMYVYVYLSMFFYLCTSVYECQSLYVSLCMSFYACLSEYGQSPRPLDQSSSQKLRIRVFFGRIQFLKKLGFGSGLDQPGSVTVCSCCRHRQTGIERHT